MAGSALRRLMAEYKRQYCFCVCFLLVQGPQANFFIYVINTIVIVYFIVSELTLNPPEGIVAGPINEENFFDWECLIV